MALVAGDADTPNTMANAIYNAIVAEFGAASGQLDADRKRGCAAMAAGIVAHIKSFGDIVIPSGVGGAGLQRADVGGTSDQPTLAPSSPVTVSGAID